MFDGLKEDSRKKLRFSTGSFLDIQTGKYEFGYGNQYYLNGGLGTCTTGLHGRGNTYKSTIVDTWVMGMLRMYPQMFCFIIDTEFSKERERLLKFAKGVRFGTDDDSVSDRVVLKSDPEWTIEHITEFIHQVCDERMENIKDLTVTTPFLDKHGAPIKIMLPTVIYIDSFSELTSSAITEFLRVKGLDDDKFRTLYMENGNRKTLLLSLLNQLANKYGLIICATARTGDNRSMGHLPPTKELTHQRQSDKIKDVGAKFTTLVHVLTQIMSCKNVNPKEPEYPSDPLDTNALDLQEVLLSSSRNKSSFSGIAVPLIVSQEYGLLNEVSYFHYLRTMCGGVIGGTSGRYTCPWLPDVVVTRKNLRENIIDNYAFCRALELVAKYQYIKSSWNTASLPVDFSQPAEKVFDRLMSNHVVMSDILETTSCWAPIDTSKKMKPGEIPGVMGRKHMTLFEVLTMAQNPSA